MMGKPIEVKDNESIAEIPVRRRGAGPITDPVNITIPKELNQRINDIVMKTGETKSSVITNLIEKGLKA